MPSLPGPLSRFSAHVGAHNWLAVAIDFIIVVLGVYVALWAGDLQAARERRQRTAKVVSKLMKDDREQGR